MNYQQQVNPRVPDKFNPKMPDFHERIIADLEAKQAEIKLRLLGTVKHRTPKLEDDLRSKRRVSEQLSYSHKPRLSEPTTDI
jgi:hypothetical protein